MNVAYRYLVDDFLAHQRIAVTGYSTTPNAPANAIYKRLQDNGYEVFAVNPKADQVQDVPCYPNLAAIPATIDWVMICSPPEASVSIVEECIALGISRVWMHRSVDKGSFDCEAEYLARDNGMLCISAGCPLMFVKPDFFHRTIMKFIANVRGLLKAPDDPKSLHCETCCADMLADLEPMQMKKPDNKREKAPI